VDVFFADDAQQNNPSRPGMGPLIAVGGLHVPDESVNVLEEQLNSLCSKYGFPPNEVFKWSPGTELWMRANLVGESRTRFFAEALTLAKVSRVGAIVIIEDLKSRKADRNAPSREIDLINLLLERIHHEFIRRQCHGIVIVSQPSGDRQYERKFLSSCAETLARGTDYVKPDRIALSILTSPPKFVRLLQLSDVVASCTTSYVSGENQYSPPVFEYIKPIFAKENGRVGGAGLKLHPDFKYANLYYWLVNDSHFWKNNLGLPLPMANYKYATSPLVP